MTENQRNALYIGGGIAALAAVWFLMSRGSVATKPDVVANPYTPGYTSFNMPPLNIPQLTAPAQTPVDQALKAGVIGCGCNGGNDGCFSASVDAGQNPVSMAQAMNVYQSQDPGLYSRLVSQLGVYDVTPLQQYMTGAGSNVSAY